MSKVVDTITNKLFITAEKDELKTKIIYIPNVKSVSPHFPDFPPQNTPPDIEYFRNIYLSYLSKIK